MFCSAKKDKQEVSMMLMMMTMAKKRIMVTILMMMTMRRRRMGCTYSAQVDRIIDAVGVENIRENVVMDKMQVLHRFLVVAAPWT